MKKTEMKKTVKVAEVTDLKIKKLTVRSGVKAAELCNTCHTPPKPIAAI